VARFQLLSKSYRITHLFPAFNTGVLGTEHGRRICNQEPLHLDHWIRCCSHITRFASCTSLQRCISFDHPSGGMTTLMCIRAVLQRPLVFLHLLLDIPGCSCWTPAIVRSWSFSALQKVMHVGFALVVTTNGLATMQMEMVHRCPRSYPRPGDVGAWRTSQYHNLQTYTLHTSQSEQTRTLCSISTSLHAIYHLLIINRTSELRRLMK
jgi:hypothetical protein